VLLERAESVFVSPVIADVNRANGFALQPQRFQQPHHGFAFIPLDIRLKFEHLLTGDDAQLAVARADSFKACLTVVTPISSPWR